MLFIIALASLAQPAPFISNTDDGGMQLAAYGPVTVAKLDTSGNVQGEPSELVPKADLDAAALRIDALEAKVVKFDKIEAELKRVEGVLESFGVQFDSSQGELSDLSVATDEFKDAIGDLIETSFKKQDDVFVTKKDARTAYAPTATVNQQFTQLGERLSQIQELVEANSESKLPRCEDPADPDNGSVEHQYANAGGDHPNVPFVPGVTIHYECKRGYGIKGATAGDADEKAFERVCYADGTWASIADKSKFDKPAECEKCKAAGYKKIEVSDFYRNTQGARWGGKDFRSGNPGEKTYWTVGPISVSEMSELNFEFEYVTGYSWNCGWSRYTGELPCLDSERFQKNGPIMNVYLQNGDNEDQKAMVYSTGMLKHYPYDNCRDNGGWGEVGTKNDGCYSPPVKVSTTKQSDGSWAMTEDTELTYAKGDLEKGQPGATKAVSRSGKYAEASWFKDATTIKVMFEFDNKGRNMHLNPHHMEMQILGASFDSVSKSCV